MGSECSLRVSLPGTEGELVPAPVSLCLEAAGGQVPAPPWSSSVERSQPRWHLEGMGLAGALLVAVQGG